MAVKTLLPVNAILKFKVPVSLDYEPVAEQIDELGNAFAVTEVLTVGVYFKESKNRYKGENSNDIELTRMAVHGYIMQTFDKSGALLPTKTLPPTILPGAMAEASFTGMPSATFFLEASMPSPFGVDRILGQAIKGYVIFETAWGTSLE